MNEHTYIGKRQPRHEDYRLLKGRGKFAADIQLPHMTQAVVLRSQHAHAKIRNIDAAKALELPGIVAIFTGEEIESYGGIPMRLAPREALRACFQPPIAKDRVRYVGEPIALIVAENRYLAEDAIAFIDVEMTPLPIIADVHEGRADGAVAIHPSLAGNVAERIEMRFGDPENAMANAPIKLRETYRIQRHMGVPLETRGLLASYDSGTDSLTVWGAAKVPHFNRQILADLLGRPEHSIRLIETEVGGGFGPRGEFYPEDFLIPWAARELNRPVQWIEDRQEHMMATNHSREQIHEIEIGADPDGKIHAFIVRGAVDMGAYIRTNGFVVPERAVAFIPGPYALGSYLAEVDCVFTNKTSMGSYRGPGRYEASFVRERAMDLVARELDLDPAEVRRKNLIPAAAMPYNSGTKAYNHDVVFDSGDYPDLFERALKRIDYDNLRAEQLTARTEGRYIGIGLSPFVEKSGVGPWETGRVRIDGSGYVEIFTGVTSVGQGVETVMAQICAEQLRLPPELIRVRHGDTGIISQGVGAYGSRGTITGGSAVWRAAGDLRKKLIKISEFLLEVNAEELVLEDGKVFVPGTDLKLTFRELAAAAQPGRRLPDGMESGLDISSTYVVGETAHPHGTHVAVVEVDPDLGVVTLLKYLIAFDIGVAINPMLVEGQLIGGMAQGIGGALLEELVYSPTAQLLTGSFMDYLLPTSEDMPKSVDILLLEDSPSPNNPLGAKGAGEAGIVGVGAAIANAIEDALVPFGVRITSLPVSPNAIFELVRSAREVKKSASFPGNGR